MNLDRFQRFSEETQSARLGAAVAFIQDNVDGSAKADLPRSGGNERLAHSVKSLCLLLYTVLQEQWTSPPPTRTGTSLSGFGAFVDRL